MSGLDALASYAISDEEDVDKIVDSEDEAMQVKKEEEMDIGGDAGEEKQADEVGGEDEDSDAKEEEEDQEPGDDTIKDVENLSTIHNESSDAEAAGSSDEGEGVDTSDLGNTLAVQAKKRAKRKSSENATALAKKLRSTSSDEVIIPPEPEGHCSVALQDKISRFLERKVKDGEDLNRSIQARKDFRNPSIYEKLILYLGIEELGTNFPPQDYHPKAWRKAPAYDELARAQREDMAKREKERKTKVEFVTAVKKTTASTSQAGTSSGEAVKKTKWDQQGSKSTDKSSKSTVISAVGAIKKQKP